VEFGSTEDAFLNRFNLNESAISSRGSQLMPLFKGIAAHPVVGSGWGTVETYVSSDPRVMLQTVNGWYTTFTFEWGYLDIILKIGLFGLFAYLAFLFSTLKRLLKIAAEQKSAGESALLTGSFLGLIALMGVHMFTPYLNHPLGIGYILIVLIAIKIYSPQQSIPA
jgi:O-antigen ligase